MSSLRKRIAIALVLVTGMLAGGIASATPITMDFDGLTPGAAVHTYYDGGCTRLLVAADCHGPDYGVAWKGARVSLDSAGYAGLVFSDHATMNIAAGFENALSFDYYNIYSPFFSGSISVYSGQNGHGTQLAHAGFGHDGSWDFLNMTFSGLAKSVVFNGSPAYMTGFDNVTLGVDPPAQSVSEPAELGMFGLGMLLIGLFAGLRRRRGQGTSD